MDNESPFVGKVDEEARLVRLSTVESPGLRPSSAAENSSLPNDPAGDDDPFDEDTPLLSRFQTYPQRESTDTEVGHEEAIHQPWMGAKELEGQPWWKKPSVGTAIHALGIYVLTMIYRYSGFCLPFSPSLSLSAAL